MPMLADQLFNEVYYFKQCNNTQLNVVSNCLHIHNYSIV